MSTARGPTSGDTSRRPASPASARTPTTTGEGHPAAPLRVTAAAQRARLAPRLDFASRIARYRGALAGASTGRGRADASDTRGDHMRGLLRPSAVATLIVAAIVAGSVTP